MVSKKGQVAELGGMVFGLITFMIIVGVALFYIGSINMKVDATVLADNAAFTCSNNLMTLIQFDTGSSSESFADLLVSSVESGDFTLFNSKVTPLLNSVSDKWKLIVTYGGVDSEPITGKEPPSDNFESCEMFLPVPCAESSEIDIQDRCNVILTLEAGY